MTNKQLYVSYHDRDSTDALKAHRLKTLRDRACRGDSDAKRYVIKIETCIKTPLFSEVVCNLSE